MQKENTAGPEDKIGLLRDFTGVAADTLRKLSPERLDGYFREAAGYRRYTGAVESALVSLLGLGVNVYNGSLEWGLFFAAFSIVSIGAACLEFRSARAHREIGRRIGEETGRSNDDVPAHRAA